jgi:hypothetical protein
LHTPTNYSQVSWGYVRLYNSLQPGLLESGGRVLREIPVTCLAAFLGQKFLPGKAAHVLGLALGKLIRAFCSLFKSTGFQGHLFGTLQKTLHFSDPIQRLPTQNNPNGQHRAPYPPCPRPASYMDMNEESPRGTGK